MTTGATHHDAQAAALRALIRSSPWLLGVLAVVRDVGDHFAMRCWVGAGAVRDLAWDTWYSDDPARDPARFDSTCVKDVDVVFFDARRPSRAFEVQVEHRLVARRPDVVWDVKNQAAVHLWYEERFGVAVEPLRSVADAVATWPETATAVAVALTAGGAIDVIAPLGLDDLMAGVHRRNPRRVTVAEYRGRLRRKQPAQRWPGVRVHDQ